MRKAHTAADFWKHVDKSAGPDKCWFWIGATYEDAYGGKKGKFSLLGRTYRIPKMAWIFSKGEDPAPRNVHRSCETIDCCNPAHLELRP